MNRVEFLKLLLEDTLSVGSIGLAVGSLIFFSVAAFLSFIFSKRGLCGILRGIATVQYSYLMLIAVEASRQWANIIYVIIAVTALFCIVFFAFILPTTLNRLIFTLTSPFIFPILYLFIGFVTGSNLPDTQVMILESLLLAGYQIKSALLLFVSVFIFGGLTTLIIWGIVSVIFRIEIEAPYIAGYKKPGSIFLLLILILSGVTYFYIALQGYLPALKIFFPTFSVSLVSWIITTVLLAAHLIYSPVIVDKIAFKEKGGR